MEETRFDLNWFILLWQFQFILKILLRKKKKIMQTNNYKNNFQNNTRNCFFVLKIYEIVSVDYPTHNFNQLFYDTVFASLNTPQKMQKMGNLEKEVFCHLSTPSIKT
eukprot:TRINITY_DN7136_c0_g2_i2.p6 TRINITY_DN7136_c0_g2~~TRINITY_DN7136_c0_g2_i2.p6  ORF type:complete len:107 (+),score=6.10 TRINITY_DN7136_c0_g2_i2:56-376(+)